MKVHSLTAVDCKQLDNVWITLLKHTLNHKVLDDTVELAASKSKTLVACAKGTEVLSCLWDIISIQADDNLSSVLAANVDVHEDLGGDFYAHQTTFRLHRRHRHRTDPDLPDRGGPENRQDLAPLP